ncbi:hypothetical protein A2U01_0113507, partial [Trifolium medium]|nr:hypothetical protein [Trifolium medium]
PGSPQGPGSSQGAMHGVSVPTGMLVSSSYNVNWIVRIV